MANSKPVGVAYSDPALGAGTTLTGGAVTSSTVDSSTVGATSPSTGNFTTLGATLNIKMPVATVAATGSNQGNAAAVLGGLTWVTAADATKGVVLPTPVSPFGEIVVIKNDDTANAVLKVYPAGSGIINALSASAAYSMAAKTSMMLVAYSATQWFTVPLLAS